MDAWPILVTLVVYKLTLLGIGWWAAGRNRDGADFYLGGRGLGPWVTALSAAASSSSAWALLGVSGQAYAFGMGAVWLLPACVSGFALNWFVLARPLRQISRETGAVTVTELLAHGAPPRIARSIVISASVITLVCLAGYVASQFLAAGKTFAETFDMDFTTAVVIGGTVVVLYTVMGGFWAVSVTDTLQGIVMVGAALAVPITALVTVGGPGELFHALGAEDPVLLDPFRGAAPAAAFGLVIGILGIGLGYPGQPHVVNRFMAMRDETAWRRGRVIAMSWAVCMYAGMLFAGWCARVLLGGGAEDSERVLIGLTMDQFHPIVAGVILAAVLSAIMSTADSQLLVCSSTIAYDLAGHAESGRVSVRKGRITVVVLSAVSILAAIFLGESVYDTVLLAWSGLGAAFGPLMLVRVLRGPVSPRGTLAAMWIGFGVTAVWVLTPLKAITGLYELVPAFALAWVAAWLGVSRAPR